MRLLCVWKSLSVLDFIKENLTYYIGEFMGTLGTVMAGTRAQANKKCLKHGKYQHFKHF